MAEHQTAANLQKWASHVLARTSPTWLVSLAWQKLTLALDLNSSLISETKLEHWWVESQPSTIKDTAVQESLSIMMCMEFLSEASYRPLSIAQRKVLFKERREVLK